MSQDRFEQEVTSEAARVAAALGAAIRGERLRRGLLLREVAEMTGIGVSTVHDLETGRIGSLEAYVRVGRALRLRREFALASGRAASAARAEDPVHSAMGEIQAAQFRSLGCCVGLDEPYQHFQFAGRVDVAVWTRDPPRLLAIENRTRFPNVQETAGSFNAKVAYFGSELAERQGIRRWVSETHAILALWSAEVLHEIRLRQASFDALCPDTAEAWDGWWSGSPPRSGRRRLLVVFDPIAGRRRDRARWLSAPEARRARARYRDYASALAALRDEGLA